jgi:hypothetical protein
MDDEEEKREAKEDFGLRQRAWTSKVEAVVRATRVPATIPAMFAQIVNHQVTQIELLRGISDVLRYQVCLLPSPHELSLLTLWRTTFLPTLPPRMRMRMRTRKMWIECGPGVF